MSRDTFTSIPAKWQLKHSLNTKNEIPAVV